MSNEAQRKAVARKLCEHWQAAPKHWLDKADEIIAVYEALMPMITYADGYRDALETVAVMLEESSHYAIVAEIRALAPPKGAAESAAALPADLALAEIGREDV